MSGGALVHRRGASRRPARLPDVQTRGVNPQEWGFTPLLECRAPRYSASAEANKEIFMERRSFVHGAGLAGVLAAGVAPAVVHAQANLRWRLTSSFPKVLDTLFGVNDIFAAKVRELSGGRFQITTHAPGELVPAFGTIDAVKDGTVEMANTAPYYYFGKDETFALACAASLYYPGISATGWADHAPETAGRLFASGGGPVGVAGLRCGRGGHNRGGNCGRCRNDSRQHHG